MIIKRQLAVFLAIMLAPFCADAQTQADRDQLIELLDRGAVAYNAGNIDEAILWLERSFEHASKNWEDGDPETLNVFNNLGVAYQQVGRLQEAENLLLQNLAIRESYFGPNATETLVGIDSMARLYDDLDQHEKAGPLHERAYSLSKALYGVISPQALRTLTNLSVHYANVGRYFEAIDGHTAVVEIRSKLYGESDASTLRARSNLAYSLNDAGDYRRALLIFKGIRTDIDDTRGLGVDWSFAQTIINGLAETYEYLGNLAKAEELFLENYNENMQRYGAASRWTIASAVNLSHLLHSTGREAEATELLLSALENAKDIYGPQHSEVGRILNNLGGVYLFRREYEEALESFEAALRIVDGIYERSHPISLMLQDNIGQSLQLLGRPREALEYFTAALSKRENSIGRTHPQTLIGLFLIAKNYRALSDFERSLEYHLEVLSQRDDALGPDHPETIRSNVAVSGLRLFLAAPDGVRLAAADLDRALTVWPLRVGREVRAGASDAVRAHLGGDSDLRDLSVSAALAFSDHADLGARALLMTKGIAGETDAALSRLVASDPREAVRDAAEALHRAEGQLHASYQSNDPDRIQSARTGRDEARRALFELIDAPLAFKPEVITPAAITEALGDGEVFLDFGIFHPADFASGDRGTPRILLAVYRAGQKVELRDLGPIEDVATAILATTDATNRTANLSQAHAALREALLDPVRDILAETQDVIISPDGILARVNFAMLQDPDAPDYHLGERLPVRIIPSGRALLEPSQDTPAPELMFLGAALSDFGPYDAERCETSRMASPEGGLCPLPNAVSEVEQIRDLFLAQEGSTASVLLENDATEAAVIRAMPGARFIHLATHGGVQLAGYSGEGLNNVGLAFHGIGTPDSEGRITTAANDGILSGAEASRLPLWGTDLVVMSACDTALGDSAGAEGIWSMAHAFRLAGVNATMMTLWKVSDETAPIFMERFYQTLIDRQNAHPEEPVEPAMRAALQETREWAMSRDDMGYWDYAPFVLVEN